MKAIFSVIPTILALAAAVPLTIDISEDTIDKLKAGNSNGIQARQSTGTTENEFLEGGCRNLILIYARGSTQEGNIVSAYLSSCIFSLSA